MCLCLCMCACKEGHHARRTRLLFLLIFANLLLRETSLIYHDVRLVFKSIGTLCSFHFDKIGFTTLIFSLILSTPSPKVFLIIEFVDDAAAVCFRLNSNSISSKSLSFRYFAYEPRTIIHISAYVWTIEMIWCACVATEQAIDKEKIVNK